MAKDINIGGRLHSIATGNVVAGADEILDDNLGKKQTQINAETNAAIQAETERAIIAENDRYTKAETYNKTELNNMITTPNQKYATVTATDQTTDVTDVLPATGSADMVYRVGNWDGTQFDETTYSEYSWNGSVYVHITTKTQIDEVFNISTYHASGGTLAKYANLSAALGTNGANIPESLRKGGMSVKFVLTSDNKYIQARCIAQNFTTDVTQWQGVDDEPTAGSDNLVKSGGVISYLDRVGNITFSGNGETLVSKSAFTAKAGKKYLIFPQSSIWEVALNTKSYRYKGYIIRDENNNTLYSVDIYEAQDVLSKAVEPFYFTPDTDTSIEIGIRAATGTIVKINVLDVTNLLSDTPNNNYEGFVSGIGVYNIVLNNINVLKNNGLLGRDFSFYWANGRTPEFREQEVDDGIELIVTFPNNVMRVLDNHTGAKRKQFTPSVTEYTLPILTALVYNLTDDTFTIKNFGNNAPDRIDPENECIVLYNTIGAYGGALLPYLIDWKLNNIPTKAISTVEYKLTDFQFGSVQRYGGMVPHSGYLYKSKFKIKPCSLSITAKSYTVNETVYYPYFRIAAIYKDGTYDFIVGGFNNADIPVCDNITINDSVDSIAFSIKYAQSATGPIINTEGEDTLSNIYQDGDVVMSIAKTIDNISAEVDNLDERVTALEEEPEDTSIFSLYPKKEFLPKIATLKKLVPYNFSSASTRNTPIVFLVFTDLHGDINNFKRIMEWKNEYNIYIDDVINAGDTVTDNHANYDNVMLPYFEEGGRNVLLALGNHDCCGGGSYKGWDGRLDYNIQDVYSEYTSLLDADGLGIVLPTQSEIGDIANYANFYYKDYTIGVVNNRPVRLFVLDSCITVDSIIHSNTGNDTAATQAYQDAQLAWFTAKLTEANTLGYDVAVVCHCVQPCEDIESSSGFTNYAEHTIDGWYSASLPSVFINAVDSFINNGGIFISWLIGHTHGNHIAKIIGHTNQLVIGFNTATSRSYGASKTNPYRTGYNGAEPITETTDAFCMVQIDTYYKIIRLVNVGTDYDMYGRTKGMIAINYNSKTILGK